MKSFRRRRLRSLPEHLAVSLIALFILSTALVPLRAAPAPGDPSADVALGKSLYDQNCTRCHGADGKGNGMAAFLLHPRPRDFTSGKFKFRSTESASIPADDDLVRTITNGLPGTSMPAWQPFLHGDSLKAVVGYVKSFSSRFMNEQPKPVHVGAPIPPSPQSIAAGRTVFEKLQCAQCHGADGTGLGAVAADLKDDEGRETKATRLSEPWTFRGGSSATDVYMRIRTGIDGSPMPVYAGAASDKEMWDLANYVRSLARKPVWEMTAGEVNQLYTAQDADAKSDPVARGKYLVQTMGCGDCHTPLHNDASMMTALYLAGGQRWSLGPYGTFITPNLTPDKETGLGRWSDDDIRNVMRKGMKKDGSRMLPFPMPWPDYAHMPDDDLNAIIAYLRTVPPVVNKIPAPEPLGFFSYLVAKFKMLMMKQPIVGGIAFGNGGSAAVQETASNQ